MPYPKPEGYDVPPVDLAPAVFEQPVVRLPWWRRKLMALRGRWAARHD